MKPHQRIRAGLTTLEGVYTEQEIDNIMGRAPGNWRRIRGGHSALRARHFMRLVFSMPEGMCPKEDKFELLKAWNEVNPQQCRVVSGVWVVGGGDA